MRTIDLGESSWGNFERAIGRVAEELDRDTGRVNYARRRRVMRDWRMPQSDLQILCAGIPRVTRTVAQMPIEMFTVVLWMQVNQAEYKDCPLLGEMRLVGQDHGFYKKLSAFLYAAAPKSARLQLRCRLEAYAVRLGVLCDESSPRAPAVDLDLHAWAAGRRW
jgi:hypothetical protein